jgi:hypothetical protein
MDKLEMHRQELTRADKWLRAFAVNKSDVSMLFEAHDIILSLMCLIQAEDLNIMMSQKNKGQNP